jgi:hypothetical protein
LKLCDPYMGSLVRKRVKEIIIVSVVSIIKTQWHSDSPGTVLFVIIITTGTRWVFQVFLILSLFCEHNNCPSTLYHYYYHKNTVIFRYSSLSLVPWSLNKSPCTLHHNYNHEDTLTRPVLSVLVLLLPFKYLFRIRNDMYARRGAQHLSKKELLVIFTLSHWKHWLLKWGSECEKKERDNKKN